MLLVFALGNSLSMANSHPTETKNELSKATLGGGCFWCLEAFYQDIEGIKRVVSGYAGGHVENPTYEEVCGKGTGHAEVVQLHFDPTVIRYEELLEYFWLIHDPTTLNRQGNDIGPQYRSIILYHDEAQKEAALKSREALDKSGKFQNPVVTEVEPLEEFYEAEGYHQDYYNRNSYQPYCQFVIKPKLEKVRKLLKEREQA